MQEKKSYPINLARFVRNQIVRRYKDTPLVVPSLSLLSDLFETLYFTSFKTEEGQPINCHIIWLDPNNPDPNPPMRIRSHYSNYIPLTDPLPFNASNLVKLSKATDPRTSSIIVFPNDEDLYIYGFMDQGNHHYASLNYEQSGGIRRPGLFQASIFGPAHIIAQFERFKIAELKVDCLITRSYDVLHKGPICQKLNIGMNQFITKVSDSVPPSELNSPLFRATTRGQVSTFAWDWRNSSKLQWIEALCRILIRVQAYQHGGAILITPDISTNLNIKYQIDYPRLNKALQNWSTRTITSGLSSKEIFLDYLLNDSETLPTDLYRAEYFANDDLDDIKAEIDAIIWFISLLSRVDGLILMSPMLEVKGFGTVINCPDDINCVYIAGDEIASEEKLIQFDHNHFGTRHRSMMRYCYYMEDAIGFVISQDGDVRAITRLGDKVVMWDSIKIRDEHYTNQMSIRDLRRNR